MSSSVGLLLDENVADETAAYLRSMDYDVVTVKEAGLAGVDDREVARFATESGRVLVTFNYDFADMASVFPPDVPGIIRLRVSRQAPEVVHRVLEEFLNIHSVSDALGAASDPFSGSRSLQGLETKGLQRITRSGGQRSSRLFAAMTL